jgi:23S rRNA (adenine2503-C2)-methyltransferase
MSHVTPESADPKQTPVPILKELLPKEMTDLFVQWGLRPYRTGQVVSWIYVYQALTFEEMSNISKSDRSFLAEHARIGDLRVMEQRRAADGTEKWLLGLEDGPGVETVLIPEEGHWTQCISTQVGCAMGCGFCRTAAMGFRRHLRTWEIVDQVVVARRGFEGGRIRNVVLMGMGEPLANYDAVIRAIRIMLLPQGLDLSKRRVTLSTCGLVPEMRKLASEGLGISIAVSLNATTDEIRSRLMPINRRYPIKILLAACRELPLPSRSRITFEYVLLKDVNDTLEDAGRLVKLLRGMRCKVNLIPHNPYPGSPFQRPSEAHVLAFQRVLADAAFTAPIRWSHGADISAACGQLAGASD